MAAAGVSPHDAGSNLGAWWKLLSGDAPPVWLNNPTIDSKVLLFGGIAIVVWLIVLWATRDRPNDDVTTSHGSYSQTQSGSGDNTMNF